MSGNVGISELDKTLRQYQSLWRLVVTNFLKISVPVKKKKQDPAVSLGNY